MNVFATYSCPEKSARSLDDQRVVKMTLESLQILSSALSIHRAWTEGLPRPTHVHHPIVQWAATGRENWEWLWTHAQALDAERLRRGCKTRQHKTLVECQDLRMDRRRRAVPVGWTPHVNCARNTKLGVDFTHIPDVHRAYRLYLSARWVRQPRAARCSVLYLYQPLTEDSYETRVPTDRRAARPSRVLRAG